MSFMQPGQIGLMDLRMVLKRGGLEVSKAENNAANQGKHPVLVLLEQLEAIGIHTTTRRQAGIGDNPCAEIILNHRITGQ